MGWSAPVHIGVQLWPTGLCDTARLAGILEQVLLSKHGGRTWHLALHLSSPHLHGWNGFSVSPRSPTVGTHGGSRPEWTGAQLYTRKVGDEWRTTQPAQGRAVAEVGSTEPAGGQGRGCMAGWGWGRAQLPPQRVRRGLASGSSLPLHK